jgi:assimilatory nitrate reductase catalytic subunit
MIRTTCPYCGVGCGIIAAPDGTITGDPEHPANRGRLCSKGAALGETLGAAGRLLHPEVSGRAARWDEALDLVALTFSRTIAAHGPDAVAFYVSGQLLTEDYYVANKLMKGFIGSANIDTNSRLCMASSVAGHIRAFGEDIVPGCYDDIEAADLVVLVGSNLAWCHPVLYQRLAAARDARGTRVVVIDPRRAATCEIADLHLALQPGTDVAVFAGLLVHLVESGCRDLAWTEPPTGFGASLAAARISAPSLEAVAALSEVPAADLARFYDWFAATERTLTLFSQGVNQSRSGTDKVNAIINCHLATGRIGRPGTGPLSLTGQPNAMGGREVGGLASQLAAHMGFTTPEIDRVRRFWRAPQMALQAGLKAVELFDAVLDGRIKALWIIGTNPAASMPRSGRVREALAGCPFIVVSDCWPTETTRFADVVLPAAGWGEKDGTVTNSVRCISRQRAFRSPPGEARPDWWIIGEVGQRMGWREAFSFRRPAAIFREHAALSAFENDGGRVFDIGALAELSDEGYARLSPVQWPARRATPADAAKRLFDGPTTFPMIDGLARFAATPYRPLAEPRGRTWPFVLNTGRVRDQWHTMTRTGRVPRLMAHQSEPRLDIHPIDADRLGVTADDLVRVDSRHGTTTLPIRLAAEQRPGEIFAPMHWTDSFASSGPIDRLVSAAADPISGQPELKGTPVSLKPLRTCWRGTLLRYAADEALPEGPYWWARVPLDRGHVFSVAGWEPLPEQSGLDDWAARLLGASPAPELISYADRGRGIFRYASIVDDRLDACLFLARRAEALPPTGPSVAALGRTILPNARLGLLAGRLVDHATAEDAGAICVCFSVGRRALSRAIVERRLTSVAEIGAALRAGTNCGSCLPELRQILRSVPRERAPTA